MGKSDVLSGRRLIVTGGSAGIGRETVRLCAANGASVVAVSRRPDYSLTSLAPNVDVLSADLRDGTEVHRVVDSAIELLGGVDALINSAGVYRVGSIAKFRPPDWQDMFETNVLGLLNITQACLPHLKNVAYADIVNVGSMGGHVVARTETSVYSGTKFAVTALSEGLRRELVDDRIRVSLVSPGAVATQLGFDAMTEEQTHSLARRRDAIALTPTDVAHQIMHILSLPPDVVIHEIRMSSMQQLQEQYGEPN